MAPEEEYLRYIQHLRATYEEALHDRDTQNMFERCIKDKLDLMVKSGKLISHSFEGIDFSKDRFSFEVTYPEGDTGISDFSLDINYYHGRTSADDGYND